MFNLKISCTNNDIFRLLLKDSEKIAKYFGKSVDELKFSDVTDYYEKHRDDEIILNEL